MSDLIKLLHIYALAMIAQLWYNFFNFRFIYSKVKIGDYTVPFINHVFQRLSTFTVVAWTFNAVFCYIPATIISVYSFYLSYKYFGGASSALIVNIISTLLTAILFMKLTTGESLNKNGWIAVMLIVLASFFAAHSGKNI